MVKVMLIQVKYNFKSVKTMSIMKAVRLIGVGKGELCITWVVSGLCCITWAVSGLCCITWAVSGLWCITWAVSGL